jgi:ABC-type branched-subunit amino acid transport system ATPase component
MSAMAIEFQGVQKSFGLAFSLGPLTLSVPRGSIYALIGPNGAGKSTALNMLMGMGEPGLGAFREQPQQVFDYEQHVVSIARARLEIEVPVKSLRLIIFGMNEQHACTDQIGRLRYP